MSRDPEAGFSMIEALVAMAVLAVGAVSLLSATEGHSARIGAITDRTVARWVAEERLTALRLGLPAQPGAVEMLGQRWSVTEERAPTGDPALDRATVVVGIDGADGGIVRLAGYLDVGDAR